MKQVHPIGGYIERVMRAHGYKPHEIYKPARISKRWFKSIRHARRVPSQTVFDHIVEALHPDDEEMTKFRSLRLCYYQCKDIPMLEKLVKKFLL